MMLSTSIAGERHFEIKYFDAPKGSYPVPQAIAQELCKEPSPVATGRSQWTA